MGFLIIFFISSLLLILPDAYIVFVVMKNVSWWWKGLFLLPTLFFFIVAIRLTFIGDNRQVYFNLIFWLFLCVLLPVLIFTLIALLGQALGLISPVINHIFRWIALGCATAWLGIALFGIFYGWRNLTVEKVDLKFSNLPTAFENYKIVQLSDMHIGTYDMAPSTVEKIVKTVNNLHPDLIVFTGDMVNSEPEEMDPYLKVLEKLQAPDGVISILGNHDYCLYKNYNGTDDSAEKAVKRVIDKEQSIGWRLLLNENIELKRGDERIAVVGVENSGGKNFIDRSDLKKAIRGLDQDEFKILLSHDPSHWRREVLPQSNIDLTLSGHTHAMQFRIGDFSPSKWTYKEWGGLYEEEGRYLHVNTGTGGNIAFRFGAYPQITLITLSK